MGEMEKISFNFPSSLPLEHRAEVLVVGGGPGGISAAVAAAREGRDVLLVEHYGFLGGMASAGEVNPFMPNHLRGESLDKGIFTEWRDRMAALGGSKNNERIIDPFVARVAAEQLCMEAGVKLLYHHRPITVKVEGRRISSVALHSKGGLSAVSAGIYIDATGDGDLATLAGCGYEYGGEGTPHAQPMTLCFKLRLDPEDLPEELRKAAADTSTGVSGWLGKYFEKIQEVYKKAQADGRTSNQRQNVLMFRAVDPFVIHFNSTRVIRKSAISGIELSAAEIEGRKQMMEMFGLLREEVEIFRHARLYSVAPQIGIRESRRVKGRAYMTRADYSRAAKYPDAIARATYPIDIHSPNGSGTEITRLPAGEWYEVPYGCIVPEDIDNLLMACRAISVDHAVHASIRVMPPVCSIGQAAGTAAAMCHEQEILPPELDGKNLRKRLIERGRNLEEIKRVVTKEKQE